MDTTPHHRGFGHNEFHLNPHFLHQVIQRINWCRWIMLNVVKRSPQFLKTTITRNYPLLRTPQIARISRMPLLTISQSLNDSVKKHSIVPEVVDEFESQGLLSIEYPTGSQVSLGNTLTVADTQETPKVQFTLNPTAGKDGKEFSISNKDKFLLVLTDPDAPSNTDHKWSEYAHWIVGDLSLNVPSEAKTEQEEVEFISTILDVSKGTEILKYEGPGPPPKTGKHRYVFLLYKQDPEVEKYDVPLGRPNWGTGVPSSGVRDYIEKHGGKLQLLSVNFFFAQNVEQ